MSKNKLYIGLIVVLLIINGVLLAMMFNHRPPPHLRGDPEEGPKNIVIERLDFNNEQIIAYEDLITKHRELIIVKEEEVRVVKRELYSLLPTNETNGKKGLYNKLGDLQKEIEALNFKHFIDIKGLCKNDQVGKFESLSKEMLEVFERGKRQDKTKR